MDACRTDTHAVTLPATCGSWQPPACPLPQFCRVPVLLPAAGLPVAACRLYMTLPAYRCAYTHYVRVHTCRAHYHIRTRLTCIRFLGSPQFCGNTRTTAHTHRPTCCQHTCRAWFATRPHTRTTPHARARHHTRYRVYCRARLRIYRLVWTHALHCRATPAHRAGPHIICASHTLPLPHTLEVYITPHYTPPHVAVTRITLGAVGVPHCRFYPHTFLPCWLEEEGGCTCTRFTFIVGDLLLQIMDGGGEGLSVILLD